MSGERVERRLTAILAADVAGYSRLMGQDEAGTLARLRNHRLELIDPKTAEHRGRIVKTTGDGILIEFPSVVEAVACAVAVQHSMAERNTPVPEDQRIVFRVGVNLGDIIVEGDDIHGDGVNVAARLEGIAELGGICVAAIVHDQVRDKLDLTFEDMGEQALKNIARSVRVYRVRAVAKAASAVKPTPALALPDKPSIAVLPFQNMSGDPEGWPFWSCNLKLCYLLRWDRDTIHNVAWFLTGANQISQQAQLWGRRKPSACLHLNLACEPGSNVLFVVIFSPTTSQDYSYMRVIGVREGNQSKKSVISLLTTMNAQRDS